MASRYVLDNAVFSFRLRLLIVVNIVITAMFSPLISFYECILLLLVFSRYIDRATVNWLGYICAYSGSVMLASRKTFEPSDDFSHYYATYLHIMKYGWSGVFDKYGSEIGLPIYYFMLSGFHFTNQVFPLFAVSMLSSALFVLWLDKFGSLYFPIKRYGIVMSISLLFYSFLSSSLIMRQMLSLSCILFAIFAVGWRSFVWLVFAILFHQSSLLTYLMFKFANRLNWFYSILAVGFGFLFVTNFNQISDIALSSDSEYDRLGTKFTYYTYSFSSNTDSDFSGLKFIGLNCIAALFSAKYMPKGWGWLMLCVGILYILFLPYPLMSLRTFLIFSAVLAGYISTFLAFRFGWMEVSWLAVAYSIYTLVKQFRLDEDYPFQLWKKFDWVGGVPFYYFIDHN